MTLIYDRLDSLLLLLDANDEKGSDIENEKEIMLLLLDDLSQLCIGKILNDNNNNITL